MFKQIENIEPKQLIIINAIISNLKENKSYENDRLMEGYNVLYVGFKNNKDYTLFNDTVNVYDEVKFNDYKFFIKIYDKDYNYILLKSVKNRDFLKELKTPLALQNAYINALKNNMYSMNAPYCQWYAFDLNRKGLISDFNYIYANSENDLFFHNNRPTFKYYYEVKTGKMYKRHYRY